MYNMQQIHEPTELYDFSTTVADVFNTTMAHALNGTNGTHVADPTKGGLGPGLKVTLKVAYALGIISNAVAIVALRSGERRVRNRKHLLLLTSLAANDLVALVGMMCSMFASEGFSPGQPVPHWYCCARVVLRVFGIGSVCITVTMALERYLALTRPFLYQKRVTYYMIRTALLVSWVWAAALTCAPIMGVGLYYDAASHKCKRYREATSGVDFGYAVFYAMFGTFLCLVLVYCNLAVIRALYAITAPRSGGPPVVRRVSKRSCRQRAANGHAHHNAATAEEVAFSRLMATLSVLFMICWLPQMVTTMLYLTMKETKWMVIMSQLSDTLMLLNYVLDPVLYVLMRQRRQGDVSTLCHSIADCFKRNHKTSTESMKTSCCPQETVVVSDSSGAEMRPLRPPVCATIKFDD
ncbi:prostaglandin D2 receptor [Maniola hyperantus]|uniref:prostaglandin D2 receptor n=1 Tax=Aphantopus hyperantus TaxID=2795564 RepID=UPI001568942A|nr:prostaglandin D2 receptor [Maniola hyperantus]